MIHLKKFSQQLAMLYKLPLSHHIGIFSSTRTCLWQRHVYASELPSGLGGVKESKQTNRKESKRTMIGKSSRGGPMQETWLLYRKTWNNPQVVFIPVAWSLCCVTVVVHDNGAITIQNVPFTTDRVNMRRVHNPFMYWKTKETPNACPNKQEVFCAQVIQRGTIAQEQKFNHCISH